MLHMKMMKNSTLKNSHHLIKSEIKAPIKIPGSKGPTWGSEGPTWLKEANLGLKEAQLGLKVIEANSGLKLFDLGAQRWTLLSPR